MQVTADVKCYYCGHVSGQLVADKEHPEAGVFHPRAGYEGPMPQPGTRLRCDRCRGPVYLEDVSPIELPFRRTRRRRARSGSTLSGAA